MTVTTRKPPPAAAATPRGRDELEQAVTTLMRMFARLAIRNSTCAGAATFRQIVVDELRIATPAEAEQVAAWLEQHP